MKLGRCCACLAVVLSAVGCASINSKTHEERMAAVAALTTQEELFAAAMDADYEDVQIAAVRRISDQRALTAVVATPRFGEEVKSIALSSITNEVYLADVVVADDSSEKHAELAVQGVRSASLLCKCAKETRFENVAVACVGKLDDELLLKQIALGSKSGVRCREKSLAKIRRETVLCDIVLSCPDVWVQDVVVPRLVESTSACRMIVAPNLADELRLMLVDRINDELFLVAYVKERKHPDAVRRKCLGKIRNESSCVSLLRQSPALEDWVVSHSIGNVAASDVLVETVLNGGHAESNRILASTKLSAPIEYEKLFEMATDDLPIQLSVRKLSSDYALSKRGQKFVEKNFRIAKDDLLRNALLLLMQDETLSRLYRKSDQVKIARAIAALPSDEMLSMSRKALFDNGVILDLALGKFSNDDRITSWALDLNPCESVLAEVSLRSQNLSTQCRALARIRDEAQIARVALHARKRTVRISAIERLTKNSERILNELAQDEDVAIKTAAVERLKVLGGTNVAEFERRAEIERQQRIAQERKLAEEQRVRDEQDRNAFERRYLSVAGAAQLSVVRKYIELDGKIHIASPMFRVTGRVAQFAGRNLVLTAYCDDGEAQVAVEMSQESKETFPKDEIVTVAGYDDGSGKNEIRLRCGKLLERGIEMGEDLR